MKRHRSINAERDPHKAVWAAIRAERDRRISDGGFRVGSHWYQSDPGSMTQQIAMAAMAFIRQYQDNVSLSYVLPVPDWATMDGAYVPITIQRAYDLLWEGAAHVSAHYNAARAHETALYALSDPDAIASYDYSGGWPEIYQSTTEA